MCNQNIKSWQQAANFEIPLRFVEVMTQQMRLQPLDEVAQLLFISSPTPNTHPLRQLELTVK